MVQALSSSNPEDDERTMVIFGAGTLNLARAGLLTLPHIQLLKQLSEKFRVYLVNEYNTSKASLCRKKTKRDLFRS